MEAEGDAVVEEVEEEADRVTIFGYSCRSFGSAIDGTEQTTGHEITLLKVFWDDGHRRRNTLCY